MKRHLLLLIAVCFLLCGMSCRKEAKNADAPDLQTDKAALREEQAVKTTVRIAIIDSGLSSAVINPDNILPGRNMILPEQDAEDRIGHGTACAAFIVGSEAARITGNCPEALLVPLVYTDIIEGAPDEAQEDGKVTPDEVEESGKNTPTPGTQVIGEISLVAQAVREAVDVYGCDIILISSGTTKDDAELHEAVIYAAGRGAVIVSCAGNDGDSNPDAVYYPGAYPEVVCVGSLESDGSKASFSQDNEFVDVWEAGGDLRLATLKGTRIRGHGTSYSAAIAAGRIAAVWTENPEMTGSAVLHICYPDRF